MLILSTVFEGYGIQDMRRLYYMMIVLTLIGWVGIARLVRGQILSLREQEFMLAAKCSGLSTGRKIFKHLIPNVMPQLIVSMTLGLGGIILTEATLGYLGLGAPLGEATWGAMINYAKNLEYLKFYPNFWAPPGICITLAILAFNFVGDGLRDAFDPKMKR
jgi:peptide/nickel transport system permease protein